MIYQGLPNEKYYDEFLKNLKECKSPSKYQKSLKKDAESRFDHGQIEEEKHYIDENQRMKDIIFAVRY